MIFKQRVLQIKLLQGDLTRGWSDVSNYIGPINHILAHFTYTNLFKI